MNDPLRVLGYVVYGIYVLTSLWLFLNALVQLHLLWQYKKARCQPALRKHYPSSSPFVTIQVPVYNEKYVIDRLLDCLALLDYPKDRFEIQVLDDSTDETSFLIEQKAKALRRRQIDISVIRRRDRTGFKAGALQYGMTFSRGDLIAIFDADFTPPPNFLKSLVPHFADRQIGLVQARWSHLNKEENYLTRIQTYLLDTHFSVEQAGRHKAGYFINFCGTAGVWRKSCIVDSGGWDGGVLSEDLDLSYRAQLKGWKLVYDQELEVPAELPSVIEAFKIQQFRWTKGMAQTSRKTLRKVLRSALPLDKKLHGVFHLLSSFVFVCLFINALLTVPLLIYRNLYPEFVPLTHYTLFTSFNLIALTLYYYSGTRSAGNLAPAQFFSHYPLFLVIYMGMSVQNAIAVLQGLLGSSSVFVRTPKFKAGGGAITSYLDKRITWINIVELLVLCYFLYGIGLSIYFNDYFMMLFFLMIGSGLAFIIYQSLVLVHSRRILAST